ncbi:hypothetical protein HanPI659440_Chr07g0270101 [Helianthus annuus]|nr:hypothetical protein HanPI659440_Chr07g0270101 [Helianthus annuus]
MKTWNVCVNNAIDSLLNLRPETNNPPPESASSLPAQRPLAADITCQNGAYRSSVGQT